MSDGERFRTVARNYCELVDGRWHYPVDAFLDAVATSLRELAQEAERLPPVEGEDVEPPIPRMSDGDWRVLFASLSDYLGERNIYWHAHDPTSERRHEECAGSVADDLADIYRDIGEGLAAWDAGHPMQAIWEWRFNYWAHWGAHASEALVAVHLWRRESHEWD